MIIIKGETDAAVVKKYDKVFWVGENSFSKLGLDEMVNIGIAVMIIAIDVRMPKHNADNV